MPTAVRRFLPLVLLLSLTSVDARGAMQIQKGAPIVEDAAGAPARRAAQPSGSVIFVRGDQVVAEFDGPVHPGERIVVLDPSLRRKGLAIVSKPLEGGTYLLAPERSTSVSEGDRLRLESEGEAAARVIAENSPEAYREFLDVYPTSPYRPRVGRELFRLAMTGGFPAEGGSVLQGQLRLAESLSREVPLAGVGIVLDRFVLPATDSEGRFRLEGLPALSEPAVLTLKVKDLRFLLASDVEVTIPAGEAAQISVEVPVTVTPTVLVGKVVDAKGNALPGAEIWTSPHTAEALTGDDGVFRISRRKTAGEGSQEVRDEPLFGGEYEVYARRKGYGVERVVAAAESFRENRVPDLRLPAQDPRREPIPDLGTDLRASLWILP